MRILLALFCAFFVIAEAHATSLQQAVRWAIETNPKIDAAQANYRATEYVLEQAKGRLFPEIELSGDVGEQVIDRPNGLGPDVNDRTRTRKQATLSIRQVLFDGFDRANDIYRSEVRISAASGRILARAEAVALSAIEAYLDIGRHQNLLGLARSNVKRHRTLLQLIRSRVDGGKAPASDYEQTLERLEAAKALQARIEVALGTAKAKYKNVVGRKAGKLKRVKHARGIPNSPDKIFEIALRNNPELQVLDAEAVIADYDRLQFKSSLYPQLFLEGSATRGEDLEGTPGRNDELKASIVLSWKLFDGGVRRNREMELAEHVSQKRFEQQSKARDIREEIDISWVRLKSGAAEVSALGRQVKQNQQLVDSYTNEYEADKRSLLDVLDAESSKFASEFEFYNAQALNIFSSYQLLAGMSSLLDHLGVEKPVGSSLPTSKSSNTGFGAIKFNNKELEIPSLR